MKIVKYNKKEKEGRCPCGGQVMFDGKGWYQAPLGFGFAGGDGRFSISMTRIYGWMGQCLECNEKVLAATGQRLVTKYPKSINDKIKAAQGAI